MRAETRAYRAVAAGLCVLLTVGAPTLPVGAELAGRN